jgi:pseudaminic acid cytidylyltransferase
MNIAIIPARIGSRRIPKKNIGIFYGRPMIEWSIQIALKCGLFNRVLVSTDSQEIAEIAIGAGAEAPFLRPEHLSNDFATTASVIQHAIIESLPNVICNVCCIYACSPFITAADLTLGLRTLESNPSKFVFPISEYSHPIQRAMEIDNNFHISFIQPKFELSRTQDLVTCFHDCGQFYWGHSSSWLNNTKMHSNGIGIPVPSWRAVDIDTLDDWMRAESLYPFFLENLPS